MVAMARGGGESLAMRAQANREKTAEALSSIVEWDKRTTLQGYRVHKKKHPPP